MGTDIEPNLTLADDELWGTPTPTPAPSPDGGPPSHLRRWLIAAGGAAAIAVAAVVGAHVASSSTQKLATAGQGAGGGGPGGAGFRGGGPGGPGGRGDAGTIASIDGSTIKLTTQAGATVSVVTTGSTTVTLSSTGTVSDVKVGDNVRVVGTTSGTTVAADQITDSASTPLADVPGGAGRGVPPGAGAAGAQANGTGTAPAAGGAAGAGRAVGGGYGFAPGGAAGAGNRFNGGPPVAGVVKSVGGGSFAVAATDGTTYTVTTSSATVVTLEKVGSVKALKVGDEIQVNGATATDGTITATNIRSGAVPAGR